MTGFVNLRSGNSSLEKAFRIAVGDIYGNIALYKGELSDFPESVILAGLGYDRPWTRDAAINVWNGCGLIFPEVSKKTLFSVLTRDRYGTRSGGQYWDSIIWVTGAWYYYLYTEDREFLEKALSISENSLCYFEETEFNPETGLFRGAPCYADGISAYPDRYTNIAPRHDIQFWPEYNKDLKTDKGWGLPIESLSTNCLYYNAYKKISCMADELNMPVNPLWNEKGEKLKQAVNDRFWLEDAGCYRYFNDPWGGSDFQDGLGESLAILLDVADKRQKVSVFEKQHISKYGIPCLWPYYKRYENFGSNHIGRHNGTVWPHIQGFWASAAAENGYKDHFFHEFSSLMNAAVMDGQFGEVFHPETGIEYGGIQEDCSGSISEYFLCHRQTWSATAFIRMVLTGLLGMSFNRKGIIFNPVIVSDYCPLVISGLKYRRAVLSVEIEGNGSGIKSFSVNGVGKRECLVPCDIEGDCRIKICMG